MHRILAYTCALTTVGCVSSGLPVTTDNPANPHATAARLPNAASALRDDPAPLPTGDPQMMHHHMPGMSMPGMDMPDAGTRMPMDMPSMQTPDGGAPSGRAPQRGEVEHAAR